MDNKKTQIVKNVIALLPNISNREIIIYRMFTGLGMPNGKLEVEKIKTNRI